MNISFLPKRIYEQINFLDKLLLIEIRFRINFPFIVLYNGKRFYLSANGLTNKIDEALICTLEDIAFVIKFVTENSVYAFNENIKKGFLTFENGIRIGLGGECVFENDSIKTIKNITSLNVRFPHLIKNCSKNFLKYIFFDKSIKSSLIIAPPFYGKTTLLKDVALFINNNTNYQILIIDERAEFEEVFGENIDKIKYSNKLFAFEYGLRSLSPQVVITDELSGEDDWKCVKNATQSGVKIIASCHGQDIDSVKDNLIKYGNIFERYFTLDLSKQYGVLKNCYNEKLEKI